MSEYNAIRDVFEDAIQTPEYRQLFYTAVKDAMESERIKQLEAELAEYKTEEPDAAAKDLNHWKGF